MSACTQLSLSETDFLANVFDALPIPVMVVDSDVHIIDFNLAAARLLERVPFAVLQPSAGEALQCIHSVESPGGCGHAQACQDCVIRNSVRDVLGGLHPGRRTGRFSLIRKGQPVDVDFLVSVSPVTGESERLVALILDDAAELSALLNPASSSPDSKVPATAPVRKTDNS